MAARIAHLTSVHPRHDTRIFLKECRSLASAGHDVTLVVADGRGEEIRDGVRFVDVGKPRGRVDRIAGATRRVLAKARELDADLYHLHDPELLPAGLALKRSGKRVIFDSHEDVPRQILTKPYLHPLARRSIATAVSLFENFVSRRLDTIVAATPVIRDKFALLGVPTVDINNFPLLGELEAEVSWEQKQREVCYIGGIAGIRGIREVVAALPMSTSGVRLNLGGNFAENGLKAQVEATPGWARVNDLGFLSRSQVRDVLARSMAGIVTFLPAPNHIEAQPNKMFEYMSAGIPVIASDFPLWRDIIEGNGCGICVDPLDPGAIASAIDRIVNDPRGARQMGENGRKAVQQRYNWTVEEEKLRDLYRKLLAKG